MLPPLDPVQAQLIALRRQQILDAAVKVFAEKGFHVTTIRDIARVAGIADGTIYHYFNNKGELLLGVLDRMTAAVRDEALAAMPDLTDVAGFLNTYLRIPLRALQAENFELFRILVSEIMVNAELRALFHQQVLNPMLTQAEPLFQGWVASGALRPLDVPLLMRALAGMLLGVIMEHALGDPVIAERWDEIPAVLSQLVQHGLLNEHS